ncbi:MAG: MBL fold metallo-hydrolase [Candidatus Saccharibacteria bacterium]|nr:MBL fold metallo-hydrolase [Candidatus Saccharibacteria bacterium]
MKIKLMGTAAIYSPYNSASTFVNNDLVVDLPNGILKQFLKDGDDISHVDTILLTHMHGDHTADTPFFALYRMLRQQAESITVVGPVGIRQKILDMYNAYDFFDARDYVEDGRANMNFIEMSEGSRIEVNGYTIEAHEVHHGNEAPALGYVINDKLGFTGDASLCEGVEKIFAQAEAIVSDSSHMEGNDDHMGVDNLKYLSEKYGKKIICTHMRDNTREELKKSTPENFIVGEDFLELEI